MSTPSENSELPQALVDDLRALGGTRAPEELWMRVQEQRQISALAELDSSQVVRAPEALWDRVQAARAARGEFAAPRGRVLPWKQLQILSAAAAVLVLGVIGFRYLGEENHTMVQPVLAGATDAATKEALRARALGMVVTPEELSPSARTVAQAFGAALPLEKRHMGMPEEGR